MGFWSFFALLLLERCGMLRCGPETVYLPSAVRVIALACLVDVVIWTVDWTHLNMRDFEVERITTSTLQIEAHTESRIRTKHFIKTLNSKHTH